MALAEPVTDAVWIATRTLTAEDGTTIEVSLGAPRALSSPAGVWACTVQYARDGLEVHEVHGADAFQALHLALASISHALEEQPLSWLPGVPDWPGFPRYITTVPEMVDRRRLHREVEELLVKHQEEALAQKGKG